MTVEAWVKPASDGSPWQTVVLKEQSSHLGYALYASASGGVPSGHAYVGVTDERTNGPAPLPLDSWSHLAVTYGRRCSPSLPRRRRDLHGRGGRPDLHRRRAPAHRRKHHLGASGSTASSTTSHIQPRPLPCGDPNRHGSGRCPDRRQNADTIAFSPS
jgi:hypothetical protein